MRFTVYTKRPIPLNSEPLRLPEHYSGVAFSQRPSAIIPPEETEPVCTEEKDEPQEKDEPDVSDAEASVCNTNEKPECPPIAAKSSSTHEDILILLLALLLLDDKGGDDTLVYILLGLLFLS